MLGFVFFAGFKILEFCRFRAFGISKNLSTFAALPILRMCFRRAVCLCCINYLDFVLACRGIGARRRSRRGCGCRRRLNARAGAWRGVGIGVYRAAGDCEGHGVAESQVFGNINCNTQKCFCLIIVHSTADFHILLGNTSQRLAFAELCGLDFIDSVLNI